MVSNCILTKGDGRAQAIFSWVTPLVDLQQKRTLTLEDLPHNPEGMHPTELLLRFETTWATELKTYGPEKASLARVFVK